MWPSFFFFFWTFSENREHTSNNLSGSRYLQADPEHFDLQDLKCKFDVILLEPPLEEYYRESGISHTERFWTWDDVRTPIPVYWSTVNASQMAAMTPCLGPMFRPFCFLHFNPLSVFWCCRSWSWKLRRYRRCVPLSFSGVARVKDWIWAEW